MKVNYQYKAIPTTQQKQTLNEWRRIGQYWYNKQLGERFDWWEDNRCAVNSCPLTCSIAEPKARPHYYSQKKQLPVLKQDYVTVGWSHEQLDFSAPPAWTMQEISKRVKKAFDRFTVGDKDGNRSGKPRFKYEASFKTLVFGDGVEDCIKHFDAKYAWVKIPKIEEWLQIRLHRPLPEGFTTKQFMLNFKPDGLCITFTLEDKRVPSFTPDPIVATWENSMGIDAVLQEDVFLATSEPACFKLPSIKSFRKNQAKLAKAQ